MIRAQLRTYVHNTQPLNFCVEKKNAKKKKREKRHKNYTKIFQRILMKYFCTRMKKKILVMGNIISVVFERIRKFWFLHYNEQNKINEKKNYWLWEKDYFCRIWNILLHKNKKNIGYGKRLQDFKEYWNFYFGTRMKKKNIN